MQIASEHNTGGGDLPPFDKITMAPPDGSKIKVEMDRGYEKNRGPPRQRRDHAFFRGCLSDCLAGRLGLGWLAAFGSLFKGDGPNGFLLFWLVGWTVGGAFAIWYLFLVLRPTIPEELLLSLPSMVHDTGVPPFSMSFGNQFQMDMWKKMFKRRTKTEFSREDMQTLRLREIDGGNRLTIDNGAERVDLGTSLREVEREWLFTVLSNT